MMLQFNIPKNSPATDNRFSICTTPVENIVEKMSPIWDYFELNDMNADEAAAEFHFVRVKMRVMENEEEKNAMK